MSSISIQLLRSSYDPGDEVAGELRLCLDQPLRARGVRLRCRGVEYTHISRSTGKTTHTYTEQNEVLSEEIVFAGSERLSTFADGLRDVWETLINRVAHTEIPAGEHAYPFSFRLPGDAPPSYDGSAAEIEYQLVANVDVPVWLDLRAARHFQVVSPPAEARDSGAVSAEYPTSNGHGGFLDAVAGAIRPEVRAHFALPRSGYVCGEWLSGSLRVENMGGARIRGVELQLLGVEEARAQGQTSVTHRQAAQEYYPWTDFLQQGNELPFRTAIPEAVVPTLERPLFSLNWFVQVRVDIGLAPDIRFAAPITLVGR